MLAIVAILIAISVVGFVVKTLFWLGVIAAIAFVVVSVAGAVGSRTNPKSLR